MPDVCRHRERRGGADVRPDAEKDFFHANADAAQEKEVYRCEKEIADANSNTLEENFSGRRGELTRCLAVIFAKKKEDCIARGRRIANAQSEKEKKFTNSNAHTVAASKEESVAVAGTVRNTAGNSK